MNAAKRPKKKEKKKKAKDVWDMSQKCKSLQARHPHCARHARTRGLPPSPAHAPPPRRPLARTPYTRTHAHARTHAHKHGHEHTVAHTRHRTRRSQEILDEEQHYKYPSWVPNYTSIAAAPSRYPARRFCSVSGLQGKYKCRVTGEYLANLAAYGTHRETKLKGMV